MLIESLIASSSRLTGIGFRTVAADKIYDEDFVPSSRARLADVASAD